MKKLVRVLLAGVMCASLLTACGGSSDTGTSGAANGGASSTTEASTGSTGSSTITIGIGGDITSLDPHNHNDTASAYATRHIYNNLVNMNENNEFVPNLAESWEFTDDVTVAFTLKDGVKFQNGETLTAEDVKFSLEREMTSPKVGHLLYMIDSIEVVDDLHFIIHMNAPSNALISSLYHSGSAILCKSYTEALEAEGKTLESAPMGCGPYKFVEWVPGASFTLEKFDDYFNPETAAKNDKLVFKIISEESARTIALENGELDMLVSVGTSDAQRLRETQGIVLDEYQYTNVEYFCGNISKAPFDNKLVRQAMNYAINKEDCIIVAMNGEATPIDSYIAEGAVGYYDTAVKYEYNLDKAKELLAEAGYPDGFTFTCYVAGDTRARSATAIQASLANIGVTMKIEQMEGSTFFEKTANGEHEACLAGWVANAEPDNTYRPLFTSEKAGPGGNRSFYKNEEVDKLVDDAAVNPDKAAVQKDYEEVLRILSEDAVWVPLYSQKGLVARNENLQGVHNSPIGMHDFYDLHY